MKINSITNYPQNKQKKPSFEATAKYAGSLRPAIKAAIKTLSFTQLQSAVNFDAKVVNGETITTLNFLAASKERVEYFFSNNFKRLIVTVEE